LTLVQLVKSDRQLIPVDENSGQEDQNDVLIYLIFVVHFAAV